MQSTSQSGLTANIGRGILAGVAGTVVMTVFQKFIEMPITGRGDSYAPRTSPNASCPCPRRHRWGELN